jgi:ABC-2 type transport system ATP-binding protein
MAPFLEVVDLHKNYGTTTALNRVSFHVEEGEIFGLLGPNGAGKTTLLSIVSCLLEPTSGKATLQGQPLTPRNREVRRLIGIVPQDLAIYNELTARENLRFFGELYDVPEGELDRHIDLILDAMGLRERADDRVEAFSGGMKRRLNLGVGLVHQPRLVLLDEPTVGVDPQSRSRIFDEVRRLNAQGVTVVYTSHYMEEVQALCSRIGIIDHGRLIACDTLPNLLKELDGLVRVRVPAVSDALRQRLRSLPDCTWKETNGDGFTHYLELTCRDVKTALVRLLTTLNETQTELISLETEEPNLERVFLERTGRALRD